MTCIRIFIAALLELSQIGSCPTLHQQENGQRNDGLFTLLYTKLYSGRLNQLQPRTIAWVNPTNVMSGEKTLDTKGHMLYQFIYIKSKSKYNGPVVLRIKMADTLEGSSVEGMRGLLGF